MKIIFGLGNPGLIYKKNRHNLGYMVVDNCAKEKGIVFKKKPFLEAKIAHFKIENQEVFLVKPLTFMNHSGRCFKRISDYYHCNLKDELVVYDDISLAWGTLRYREKGSSGGHNGMRSILELMQTINIKRLRVGIGKDITEGDLSEYVLSNFSHQEEKELKAILDIATSFCFDWITKDTTYLTNHYNKNFLSKKE